MENLPPEQTNPNPDNGNPAPQPAGTQTPAEKAPGTLLSGGPTPTHWTDALPDDLKADAGLKSFKSADDALRSFINARKAIGKKGLTRPPEGAGEEELNAYLNTRRGNIQAYRANPDDYAKIADKEDFGEIASRCFALGLGNEEFEGVMDIIGEFQDATITKMQALNQSRLNEAVLNLQQEYGKEFQHKIETVKQFMDNNAEARDAFGEYGCENDPRIFKLMLKFAESTQEGGNAQLSPEQVLDKSGLERRRDEIRKNPLFFAKNSPEKQALREEYAKLCHEIAKRG